MGAVVIIAIVAAIAATKGFSGTEDSIKVDEKGKSSLFKDDQAVYIS